MWRKEYDAFIGARITNDAQSASKDCLKSLPSKKEFFLKREKIRASIDLKAKYYF